MDNEQSFREQHSKKQIIESFHAVYACIVSGKFILNPSIGKISNVMLCGRVIGMCYYLEISRFSQYLTLASGESNVVTSEYFAPIQNVRMYTNDIHLFDMVKKQGIKCR